MFVKWAAFSFALILIVFAGLKIYWFLNPVQEQIEPDDSNIEVLSSQNCRVSQNYAEAVNENTFTLLKLLSIISTEPSPLKIEDLFPSYYPMLLSTRHYHEDIHQELPTCARSLNQTYINTLTAYQDVLALILAEQTYPDNRRYETRLQQAKEHLNEQWQTVAQISKETNLSGMDE
jgi:hypothetical protein